MVHQDNQHPRIDQPGYQNPFLVPLLLILVFAIIEFAGGLWTQSLALLGDAWHMISDVAALAIAMVASYQARKNPNADSKVEFFASIINALIMLVVIAWIVFEAFERLASPRPVIGAYVMLIAFIGLVVNLVVARQLHRHEGEKGLNHQAAFLHVIGDILGSIAALLAGLVVHFTGWLPIDAVLSIFISLLLLIGTLNLIKNIWQDLTGRKTQHHHGHHH